MTTVGELSTASDGIVLSAVESANFSCFDGKLHCIVVGMRFSRTLPAERG